jgi:hypothetical protein
MRVFLASVLAAAIATPAAAQYYYSQPTVWGYDWLGRPIMTGTQIVTVKRVRPGAYAYAQDPYVEHRVSSGNDVYVNGVYAGSDPDPRIRETLRREFLSESSIR